MAYADSSLLLKLYLREPETPAALAALNKATGPVIFTALHRLEITNAIRRNLAAKNIRRGQALKALQTLRHDLRSGFYHQPAVDWARVFRRAQGLSRRHAGKLAVRSLDLLHVALALEFPSVYVSSTPYQGYTMKGLTLGGEFLTFDNRQRQAASAEGLIVTP
jgi:predicted nucleic acid-binding protein